MTSVSYIRSFNEYNADSSLLKNSVVELPWNVPKAHFPIFHVLFIIKLQTTMTTTSTMTMPYLSASAQAPARTQLLAYYPDEDADDPAGHAAGADLRDRRGRSGV